MNVGFVVYGDIETTSGGFLYDRKLIEGLRERGDTVQILELPWPSYPRGLYEGVVARLDRFTADFDVFLQDELAHPTLWGLNARLRRRCDVPIVSVVHHLRCSEAHPRPERACYRAVERRYLETVDAAVCNSVFTRESVTDLTPLPTAIAPPAGNRFDPAIDADAITTRAHHGPLEVCFLGSIVPRKNLHTLIEGLARLPDDRWRLRVVGDTGVDSSYVRHVRQVITRSGVGDRVSMSGALDDDALAGVLRGSHLLAIPSIHEGFGIAYLEGMSFGLPALATTAGGAREVVAHGETGYLCSPGDVEGISRRIRALADDRESLAEMGVAARERYEAHPTWAESATRVGRFLDRVVSETGREDTSGGDGGGDNKNDGHGRNANRRDRRRHTGGRRALA